MRTNFRAPVFAAALLAAVASAAVAQTATQWKRSTPTAQALAAAPIDDLVTRIRAGNFGNIDRLVIVRNGELVVSETFERDYQAISRGRTSPLGCGFETCSSASEIHAYNYLHPDWHPFIKGRRVHTLQSITKSVTSAVIGAAIHQGKIRGVETPLLSYFERYDLSRIDPRLRKATLADLLTMRSGIEWHESDRPLDETNTTLQLERSPDWIRFTLAQPMDAEPGTKWVYNSGGSQLMSEVIRHATGLHADAFAEQFLFGPLGIRDYYWKKTPTGHPDTEGGLYLEAEDLARIGQLFLDDGVWAGKRLLPAGWARESTARHVDQIAPNGPGYGYQWWRYDRRGTEIWAGNGFGGQFLLVLPQQRIVAVVNSWNVFNAPTQGILSPFIDALITAAATS